MDEVKPVSYSRSQGKKGKENYDREGTGSLTLFLTAGNGSEIPKLISSPVFL